MSEGDAERHTIQEGWLGAWSTYLVANPDATAIEALQFIQAGHRTADQGMITQQAIGALTVLRNDAIDRGLHEMALTLGWSIMRLQVERSQALRY